MTKYYFKKPKSEIVRDVFHWLLISGAICIAATSPYFIVNIMKGFGNAKKYDRKKLSDTFSRLKRQGYINIEMRNHQIYISLTKQGKKKAGRFQINDLKIKKPKKWDKKWRIIIFDIAELKKIQREAFRGKLKELGFQPLQKSVWIHPFDCKSEVKLLKDFFDLSDNELRLIVSISIGEDISLRKMFKL